MARLVTQSAPEENDAQDASGVRTDDAILSEAQERFGWAESAESPWRAKALEDRTFALTEVQWDPITADKRQREGRPVLTVNRIKPMLLQLTNDVRQSTPMLLVSPVGNADVKVAEVWQGLIRHIEYDSDAAVAYDTAAFCAATDGKGYIRLSTAYESATSLDQVIRIERIRNPYAVYMDPGAQKQDGSDAEWCFVLSDMTWPAFRTRYPDSKHSKPDEGTTWSTASPGNELPDWVRSDGVRVADYYVREYHDAWVSLVQDPETGEQSVVTSRTPPPDVLDPLTGESRSPVVQGPDGTPVQRQTRIPVVMHYQLTADEILGRTEWPGQYIPVVRVCGLEVEINGRVDYQGIVRGLKDAQRILNYALAGAVENVALAPKAPFIGPVGAFESDPNWAQLNTTTPAYLAYDVVYDKHGNPAPPPQRNFGEPPIQAVMQLVMAAADELKQMGIPDAGMGQRSNETSGIAIQRRAQMAQTTWFHIVDNLQNSERHIGRVILDAGPRVYDTPRVLRIIGEDDSPQTVTVNAPTEHQGEQTTLDLTQTGFDVVLSSGPSYQTKRQETADATLNLMKNLPPQQAAVISDLGVRALDIPYSAEMAERIKRTLPPGVVQDNSQDPHVQQMQQQMAAMQQQIQALQAGEAYKAAELQLKHQGLELDWARLAWDREKGYLDAQVRALGDAEKAGITTNSTLLEHEMDAIRHHEAQEHEQYEDRSGMPQGAPYTMGPQGPPSPMAAPPMPAPDPRMAASAAAGGM